MIPHDGIMPPDGLLQNLRPPQLKVRVRIGSGHTSPEVTGRVLSTHSEMKPVSKKEKLCPHGPSPRSGFLDRTKTAIWAKVEVL